LAALSGLEELGTVARDAVGVLIKALKDRRVGVRLSSTYALGAMGAEAAAAVPALTKALDDRDAAVRGYAARALGEIGPEARAAVPALTRLLEDHSPTRSMSPDVVSSLAAAALSKIGAPAVGELTSALSSEDEWVRRSASEALYAMGAASGDAADALEQALGDPDLGVRIRAAATLFGLGGPAAEKAIRAMIDAVVRQEEYWEYAASALVDFGEAVGPAVMRALEASACGASAKVGLARVLVEIGADPRAAVPALVDALRDWQQGVRQAVYELLGEIGPDAQEAVPALIETLSRGDIEDHMAAAETLGRIGPNAREAVPALIAALGDGRRVRRCALRALKKIEPQAAAAAVGADA